MQFQKATKKKAKLRLTLDGPAGSGKTYSALELAKKLGGRVAVIDTEHGSAAKYADRFEFDSVELPEFSLETYLKAIGAAAQAGYDVLIIDSLSHAWTGKGGALEQVDRIGGNNKFTNGWKQVTPLHNRLIDTILSFPGHVICTMRTKTEWVIEQDKNGRSVPRKIGLAPVQREGMEFEFDVVADLSAEGHLTISKTRCPDLSGSAGLLRREEIAEVGNKLVAWLSDGSVAPVGVQAAPVVTPPSPPVANDDRPVTAPAVVEKVPKPPAVTTAAVASKPASNSLVRAQRLWKAAQAMQMDKDAFKKWTEAELGAAKSSSSLSELELSHLETKMKLLSEARVSEPF